MRYSFSLLQCFSSPSRTFLVPPAMSAALLKAMVAKVRAISTSQLVQKIPFLLCIFMPLPHSKEISNANHPSASTILLIQDGKRREMFTVLLKTLNKQALWEACRIDFCLPIPCSEQASRALMFQYIGFLHTGDGGVSHQSPARGYVVSSTCVHCSPAPSSDVWCVLHHRWLHSRSYTARSKKLRSLEKLQRMSNINQ